MELLRFIKWQWNRFQYDEIVLGFDLIATSSTYAYVWYTNSFLLALLVSAGVFFGIVLIAVIGQRIHKQWKLYIQDRDREAQRIVDRLRGGSR